MYSVVRLTTERDSFTQHLAGFAMTNKDKGKGKAVEVDHPPFEPFEFRREHKNMMFGSVLDRYAMQLRADLQISA